MADTETEVIAEHVYEFDERQIAISNIKLDELNYRHGEVDNQLSAIRAVIDHQGDRLVGLATHILKHGLAPGERIQVIADDQTGESDAYVVTEGNRRITVFKLLDNPDLAAGTDVHEAFRKLAREFARRPVRQLPCVVLQDRENAEVWMDVRHSTNMGGAGIEKWDAVGMSNREASQGRSRRWWAVLEFLESSGVDVKGIRDGLKKKTTAADRVLGTKIIKDELGVSFKKDGTITFGNGDAKAGVRLLNAMMSAMAAPGFSTNDVHAFGDREAWIRQFNSLSVLTRSKTDTRPAEQSGGARKGDSDSAGDTATSEKGWRPDDTSDTTSRSGGATEEAEESDDTSDGKQEKSGRRTKSAKPRKTLAPKGRDKSLFIKDGRINQIYNEATRTNVEDHPAMSAVIIRVFLELACEHYLVEKKVQHPGNKEWDKIGIKLKDKVEATLKSLDPSGSMNELKEVRRGVGGDDHIHSPSRLHDYVHGRETIPVPSELPKIWDRYHPLFIKIFDALR